MDWQGPIDGIHWVRSVPLPIGGQRSCCESAQSPSTIRISGRFRHCDCIPLHICGTRYFVRFDIRMASPDDCSRCFTAAGGVGGQATGKKEQEEALKLPSRGYVGTQLGILLQLAEVVAVVTLRLSVARLVRSISGATDVRSVAGAR
jgi:hypothetical protein